MKEGGGGIRTCVTWVMVRLQFRYPCKHEMKWKRDFFYLATNWLYDPLVFVSLLKFCVQGLAKFIFSAKN